MCGSHPTRPTQHPTGRPTRRTVITGAATLAAIGLVTGPARAAAALGSPTDQRVLAPITVATGLDIHPRDDWGADLPPKRPMGPEDVRFLLVHHTASSNLVPDPRAVIRETYAFQTGPSKGWPDVCYHFFVGPDGSVWEGRAGSLTGPVVADATGGNQGFAQLVCLIGNFVDQPPTEAAQDSLARLLLFLADRYHVDTDPGATVTFTSRGSNKYPAGAEITTSTISGHRDTSATACPGDQAYVLLPSWRARVDATRLHRTQTGRYRTATRRDYHLD